MTTTKAFLLDYGGTLDTGGNHWGQVIWHAYQQYLPAIGYEDYRDAYVKTERWLGNNPIINPETNFKEVLQIKIKHQIGLLAEKIKEGKALNAAEEILMNEKTNIMVELLYKQTQDTLNKSRRVLAELKNTNRIALVSNFYGNLNTVINEFHLDKLFEQVIESAQVGIRKPDKAIYELAIKRMGLMPDSVIVVGDSIKNDIRPATLLGCETVWIEGESWSKTEEETSLATHKISDIAELLTVSFQ